MLNYSKIVYCCSKTLIGFYFREDGNLYTILFNSFVLYRYGRYEETKDKYRAYNNSNNSKQDNMFYSKIKQFI